MERTQKLAEHSCLEWGAEDVDRIIAFENLHITLTENELLEIANNAIASASNRVCELINEEIYDLLCKKIKEKK